MVLTLLIIANPSIYSGHSSIHEEVSVSSTATVQYDDFPEAFKFSPLHVDGKLLKNEIGQSIVLRGVNVYSWRMRDHGGGVERQMQLVKNWGCNIVRAVFTLSSYYEGTSKPHIEELIHVAKQLEIYVMIGEWSSTIKPEPSLGWTKFKQYWAQFASDHKNDWHILYNILNEPYDDGSGRLTSSLYEQHMEETIDGIRQHVPGAVAIIDGLEKKDSASLTSLSFLQTDPIDRPNVFYDVHIYRNKDSTSNPFGQGYHGKYIDWALDRGYLVWIGETNIYPERYWWEENGVYVTDQLSVDEFDDILDECDSRQIGYGAWAWVPNNFPPLLKSWEGVPNQSGEILIEHLSDGKG